MVFSRRRIEIESDTLLNNCDEVCKCKSRDVWKRSIVAPTSSLKDTCKLPFASQMNREIGP